MSGKIVPETYKVSEHIFTKQRIVVTIKTTKYLAKQAKACDAKLKGLGPPWQPVALLKVSQEVTGELNVQVAFLFLKGE